MSAWTHPFKVYVSNKDSDGTIYSLTSPMWMVLLVYMLLMVNAIVWGTIGLVEAVQYIL